MKTKVNDDFEKFRVFFFRLVTLKPESLAVTLFQMEQFPK